MGKRSDNRKWLICTAALAVSCAAAIPLMAQSAGNPVARYDMKAETISGLGGMGSGMGAAMSMAFGGGGNSVQHGLLLELGSRNAAADGKPKADHFMPAGAKLGKSVALKTPVATPSEPVPREFQRPKGRMLIYWGCGEHAPKGQPVVIDFAKVAAGQMPPGLFSTNVPVDNWVSVAASRTYARWPADDKKSVKSDSSLLGAHRVAGNYSPEMNFTLNKDFMAALRASNVAQASGATLLSWTDVPEATGYYAWVIGGKGGAGGEMTDVVWWTSSASREFGGGLSDWLSPATVQRLVGNRTVMSPQTSTCIVPAEVKRDAPDYMFGMLTAYGPQEDFAFPPRPANAKAAWNPEWTARIRHKSSTSFLMGVAGMGDAGAQQQPQCQPKKKKKGLGGLGGALGGAIGGVLGGGGSSNDGC